MRVPITYLNSADHSPWTESLARSDDLPARPSGPWIETKHKLLTYYGHLFATGMKNSWKSRNYIELFSGPGKCFIRDTGQEDLGSPLKIIEHEFTKFIFTEKSVPAAEALAKRLEPASNSAHTEIWCGDCAEAIQKIQIPGNSLTFAFIDPTGTGHAPFSLIEILRQKTRCDLLINVQHGMGIKMNVHQYTPDAREESALTQFLGHDRWKGLARHNAKEFFIGVLDLYKQQLDKLGFSFTGREVLISNKQGTGLYLLLFASGHPRGKEFWDKSLKGVMHPELDLGL
ncbi:MAG TPA: three-Cys-motif partner protein TcmP [Verrucomicrobiae bacterium]|jgi:three-Cys-motif partner protein